MNNEYIDINKIKETKGLTSTRSIRLEINKPESKYIAREVKVVGGISYEILFSSLEPELQQNFNNSSLFICISFLIHNFIYNPTAQYDIILV